MVEQALRDRTVQTVGSAPGVIPEAAGRPLRVLMLQDHLLENGGLRVVHDLAQRLQDTTVSAEMFVLQGSLPGRSLTPSPNVPVIYGVEAPKPLRWALPIGFWRLLRECRRHDVIVAGSEVGFTLLLGWFAATMTGKPFVSMIQSPLADAITTWVPRPLHGLTRWVSSRVSAAVCVSPELMQGVVNIGLPRDRVTTVPVGVDAERIRSMALEPSPVKLPRGRYLIAAGRLSAQKGFDLLIRAHATALRAGQQHSLIIVGEGNERAALEQLTRDLGLDDSVHLVGFVENPHPLLSAADAFVLSSRREGMGGLVLLEAMAHSTPVIAADCPTGPRELLNGGALGAIVAAEDAEALAGAIVDHLADPGPLRAKAMGGPARVEDFDPKMAANRFSDVLNRISGRQQPMRIERRRTPGRRIHLAA